MAESQSSQSGQPSAVSKKELKAQEKAKKQAAKKSRAAKKSDPIKTALRNMYWFFMALAFALVVWMGYEAFMIYASNTSVKP